MRTNFLKYNERTIMIEFFNMTITKPTQIHKILFLSLFLLTVFFLVTVPIFAEPLIVDPNFEVEKFVDGLFLPTTMEFVGEDIDDLIEQVAHKEKGDSQEDPVQFYLTKGEYETLSITERNQRALDRYWSKKKSSWEIGRDYERYIGYLYENEGYSVYYQGIEAGLEDLGRDLIAKRDGEIRVIQCKYWAQYKTIHEKHNKS